MVKAVTDIKGPGADDYVNAGDEVDKSMFSKEQWEELEASGAVETKEEAAEAKAAEKAAPPAKAKEA